MSIHRVLTAIGLTAGLLLLLAGPILAADDLLPTLTAGTGNGVRFGPGGGGYQVTFDYFTGESVRTHLAWTQAPEIDGSAATISVSGRITNGGVGDIALVFGQSQQDYHAVVASEDFVRRRWWVGHFSAASRQFQPIAVEQSDVIRFLTDGNDLSVTIRQREGGTPLLVVRVNGTQVAEVVARSALGDGTRLVNGVGLLSTAYNDTIETTYLFNRLVVEPTE